MKGFTALCLVFLLSLPAVAVDGTRVKYVGGTAGGVDSGTTGTLDTTSESSLIFAHAGKKLEIPYASIESYRYSKQAARHLGVLPFIAVSLLKVRQRRHFFRITYRENRDQGSVEHVAIFEVPKHMPGTFAAVLEVRGAHGNLAANPCGCTVAEY